MSTIDDFANDMARIITLAERWGAFKDARAAAAAEAAAPVITPPAKPPMITNSGISEVPVKGAQ